MVRIFTDSNTNEMYSHLCAGFYFLSSPGWSFHDVCVRLYR